jgi:hypothetical protein
MSLRAAPVDETVLAGLMRHFGVSYSAFVYRLASRGVGLLTIRARDGWLAEPVNAVLRAANDPAPAELSTADESKRIPPRLWRAAQAGYQTGRVGIGTLAALADEDAEQLFVRLAADGVRPPLPSDDDMRDL